MTWGTQKFETLEFVANFESALINILVEDGCNRNHDTLHLFSRFVSPDTLSSMASRLSGAGSTAEIPFAQKPELASATFIDQFVNIVARNGSKVALHEVDNNREISYAALNKLANRIAHAIIEKRPRSKSPVGVFMNRSVNCVAAMIGVLKAGCAYLPLDPSYPKQRLDSMIATSKCELILVDDSTITSASDLIQDKELISVDELIMFSEDNPNVQVSSNDLMYVIFTSGSTGTPKGVMIPHSNVLNAVRYFNDRLQICAKDKVLAHTSFNFDISVLEIWCALTTGASIELMEKTLEHAASLGDELVTKGITVAQATPSLWKLSFASPWKAPHTRIIVGGEALTVDVAQQLVKRAGRVFNAYGPTETTIWSTCNELSPTQVLSTCCIGKPIWNTQVTVLTDSADGAGEIVIAGDGIFGGYINQPERTSEKTLVLNNARFYRTGDRGRLLNDGSIEYIGRIDDQVKIRGFRVELGEVEECARQVKQVEDCAAVFDELKQQLVLFVKPENCDIEQVKSHIKISLPMQCVPNLVLTTTTIPLTLNGKTNRLELKKRAREVLEQRQIVNKPTTAVEQSIHDIWKHVFNSSADIDVHTDFFSLGGHSLHTVQIVSTIRANLNVQITLQDFFGCPTISQLAKLVENELAAQKTLKSFVEVLTDDLQFAVTPPTTVDHNQYQEVVLLTGASGFVGMKVLEALLQRRKDCTVYCLSRHVAKLVAEVDSRLAVYSSRIRCIEGKPELPSLGLAKESYADLRNKITKIVHCGAEVNFLKDYLHLASNVESTKHLIEFAADKGIPLIYISTNNPFYLDPEENIATLIENFPNTMGYIQTKLVSEYIVQKNLRHYTIIRLPLVSSRSLTDDCNQNELLMAVLKSSSSLGSYPDIQAEIDVLPVDIVCRILADIIENPDKHARLLSVSNSEPLTLKDIVERVGLQLKSSSLENWKRKSGSDFAKFLAILHENAFPPKVRHGRFRFVEDTWS